MQVQTILSMLDFLFKNKESIWLEAYSAGFTKGLDIAGIKEITGKVKDQEIQNSLSRLDEMVMKRIDELKLVHLKSVAEVVAKKNEFITKRTSTQNISDQNKYDNFIKVLDWVIEHRNGDQIL